MTEKDTLALCNDLVDNMAFQIAQLKAILAPRDPRPVAVHDGSVVGVIGPRPTDDRPSSPA